MFKPPDYKAIEVALWKHNATEVLSELEQQDQSLLEKIETFSENFGYAVDDVKAQIRNNEMFAATFSKSPTKQGCHKREAKRWLTHNLSGSIVELPSSRQDGLYVRDDGEIMEGRMWNDASLPHKSMDFKWTQNGTIIYAMHKYTKVSGGTQNRQFIDVRDALRKFSHAQDSNIVFIAIVDGDYYTDEKITELRCLTRGTPPRSYATKIEGVPDIMKTLKS